MDKWKVERQKRLAQQKDASKSKRAIFTADKMLPNKELIGDKDKYYITINNHKIGIYKTIKNRALDETNIDRPERIDK